MAQFIVRQIEDSVIAQLKERAKRHGRSLQAELKEILHDAVRNEQDDNKGRETLHR